MPDWPHAPIHRLDEQGTYFVTAGTYLKRRHFNTHEKLRLLHEALLQHAASFAWELQAWAVLANHYHFVAISPENPKCLAEMLSKLHENTARELNALDNTKGRTVWFQYWDKQLTFPRSYFARLNYVMQNPVHHGVVHDATEYPWCSASWFERTAKSAFKRLVKSFKIDRVKVYDDV